MSVIVDKASPADIEQLLYLYFTVYGTDYPLALGTERAVMTSLMEDPKNLWLVARDEVSKSLKASILFEVDATYKIARAEGMVVHPDCRRQNVAKTLLDVGCRELLKSNGDVHSIYATTRTNNIRPQLLFLRSGFHPLGIFPNAHKLKNYETLTLLARFAPGILESRKALGPLPEKLGRLTSLMNQSLGIKDSLELLPTEIEPPQGDEIDFELIYAPHFVLNRFNKRFQDPYDRFYPFHTPNFLVTAKNEDVEFYAHLNKCDGYCTIIAMTEPCWKLSGRLKPLLRQLRSFGVSYLELLMDLKHTRSLNSLLAAQFLPSALYPAMYYRDNEHHDLVLLTRTMEPLDFRGMEIDRSFKPFVDQYIDLWKHMHLDVLEIMPS